MNTDLWENSMRDAIQTWYYSILLPSGHSMFKSTPPHLRRRDFVSELLQDLRWESSKKGVQGPIGRVSLV